MFNFIISLLSFCVYFFSITPYDVWKEKKLYGKVSMGVVRTTYLIDADGVIEKVWNRAKPDTNAREILEYIAKGE